MCRAFAVVLLLIAGSAMAGDFSDGPNRYEINLAPPFHQYAMSPSDHHWAESLLRNLHQRGHVTYLTRTDIPLWRDSVRIDGAVYHPISSPSDWYYIADSDTILILSDHAIISPGCGGFSLHAPKSRSFIVAQYFTSPCVPVLRHSDIDRGKVWWYQGHAFDRLASE